PATMTSQGAAARSVSARARSGQLFTTAAAPTTLWRMRAASSPVRSTTSTLGSGALTESSRRQSQSVALVTQGGDVRAAELDVESLAERQDEGVVEAREQRVQGRERQVGDEARRRVEGDVEDRDGGGAAQEAAQAERARTDGLGVARAELVRIAERRAVVARRGLRSGGDVDLGGTEERRPHQRQVEGEVGGGVEVDGLGRRSHGDARGGAVDGGQRPGSAGCGDIDREGSVEFHHHSLAAPAAGWAAEWAQRAGRDARA